MVLRAEAFFAGLRVDVGVVIGFFAEVCFLTDFCLFAGLTAFAILAPLMYLEWCNQDRQS